MMLRWMLIGIGVVSGIVGCVAELGAFAAAQVATPALIVVATVPPEPTPLPPLVLPREEFAEQAMAIATPTPDAAIPGIGVQSPQVALATYGVVTVSFDEQNPNNSAALVSTPHGVVMAHVGQEVDGFRIIGITKAGVVFQGGVFIPVGYSQQASNPQVPPIGASLPSQRVPVNVEQTGPSPSPSPYLSATPGSANVQTTVQKTTQTQQRQQPLFVNSQQVLPTPAAVNVFTPVATPTPSQ